MERRTFLRLSGAAGLLPAVSIQSKSVLAASQESGGNPDVKPNELQKSWMDMQFGMFIHFGINTYYDVEWSDGTLDPEKYNPTELDTDQWCRVASEAGMKYMVLVTKHHDGFCNWPTGYTDYSVTSTPWDGDLVGELVRSARKYDLKVGFYYSLWDSHEPSHNLDDYAYVDFMKNQLRELLTGYGPIVELWFDGFWKKQRTGWQGNADEFIAAWRMEGAYRWQMDHLYQYIKELQPDCLVMNNSTGAYPGVPIHPVDIRSGEKATEVTDDQKVWRWLGDEIYLPLQIETTMTRKGKDRFPTGSWFWHDWDHSAASKKQIMEWLTTAEAMEANLLLNVGPMANGKLRPEDVSVLSSLRT